MGKATLDGQHCVGVCLPGSHKKGEKLRQKPHANSMGDNTMTSHPNPFVSNLRSTSILSSVAMAEENEGPGL